MIKEIITYEGLSNTGKTKTAFSEYLQLVDNNQRAIYLTKFVNEKNELRNDNRHVLTLSGWIIKEVRRIKPYADIYKDYDSEINNCKKPDIDFNKVNTMFFEIFDNDLQRFNFIWKDSIVFIDGYHNFTYADLLIIQLIARKVDNVTLCFIGNKYADIYSFLRKEIPNAKKCNFGRIEEDYHHKIDKQVYFNKPVFSNSSLLRFTDNIIQSYIKPEPSYQYKYDTCPEIVVKQHMHYFPNEIEETDFIINQAIKYHKKGLTVAIITKKKVDKIPFLEWKESNKAHWLYASHIHNSVGIKADVVFIVKVDTFETDKSVLYSAISCAKEKVIFSSTLSFKYPLNVDNSVIMYHNKPKDNPQRYNNLKIIHTDKRNFSKQKLSGYIDSITLSVKQKQAISVDIKQKGSPRKSSKYNVKRVDNGITKVGLTYNKCHKTYYFEFMDLNLLKKNYYTDLDIEKYTSNYCHDFFNGKVISKDMKIHRIDLCRIVDKEDYLMSVLINNQIKCKNPLLDEYQNEYDCFDISLLEEHTLYYNFCDLGPSKLTLRIYKPCNKDNDNKYNNKNLYKLEFQIHRRAITKKYAFGKPLYMNELINSTSDTDNYLGSIFDSIFDYRVKK